MITNKSYKYFVSTHEINNKEFDINNIDNRLLSSTPYLALINFMKIKYDTHLGKDKLFRVSDEYSDNIYNYRIIIYKIKDSYLKFMSDYPDESQAIYVKINDRDKIDHVIEPTTNKAIFLREELDKYGIDIILVNKESLFKDTKEQYQKAIDIIDEFAEEIDSSDSFFRSFNIFETDIKIEKIISWSYSAIVGEYDLSEIKDMDMNRANKILHDLIYKVNKSISKEYYIEIRDINIGYGIIVLRRGDIIKENNNKYNSLWNAIFESESFCNIGFNIKNIYYNDVVECIDLTHIVNNMYDREILTESKKVFGGEYTPIYIVLTKTGTPSSKIASNFNNTPYNHVSISFDPDLSILYSFSSVVELDKLGFSIEATNKSYLSKYDRAESQIYVVFVNQDQLRKINAYIDNTISNYKKERYNFIGLMGHILNKPLERENHKFCSEFVDEIFKLVNIDLTNKQSGLVEPYDFAKGNVSVIFKVFEGPLETFNSKRISTFIDKAFSRSRFALEESTIINESIFSKKFYTIDNRTGLTKKTFSKNIVYMSKKKALISHIRFNSINKNNIYIISDRSILNEKISIYSMDIKNVKNIDKNYKYGEATGSIALIEEDYGTVESLLKKYNVKYKYYNISKISSTIRREANKLIRIANDLIKSDEFNDMNGSIYPSSSTKSDLSSLKNTIVDISILDCDLWKYNRLARTDNDKNDIFFSKVNKITNQLNESINDKDNLKVKWDGDWDSATIYLTYTGEILSESHSREINDTVEDNRFIDGYIDPRPDHKYNTIDLGDGTRIELEHVSHNILQEAKSFPVQFDKDGNLLIKNMRKVDYQTEFNNSHRLLGIYEKDKNIEGIKFELSKLWFINSLIEGKLYSRKRPSHSKRKELLDVRARVLNDFHKYLAFVNKYDNSFNFSEYYDNTPFSDAEIKIYKDTIAGIGKIVKSISKLI